ncbi:hypothetical protein [Deinococcus roseus]|uniref:Uncharacterized protein n=1 Tax=Deinococcus roseus TaxID=392414 RepID=A0ABQ2D4T2_9DEIO|nr:hypothetical protein [Deinococcus roseus]GGJ42757.1 hypothetical protein GCM10008938_31140 [Deinococcus roseus]
MILKIDVWAGYTSSASILKGLLYGPPEPPAQHSWFISHFQLPADVELQEFYRPPGQNMHQVIRQAHLPEVLAQQILQDLVSAMVSQRIQRVDALILGLALADPPVVTVGRMRTAQIFYLGRYQQKNPEPEKA